MELPYQYEFGWDNVYCYPNSSVLRNKLDITDDELFSEAERKITSVRLYDLKPNPVKGNFDLLHLQRFHRSIFGDVYTWAGQLRTVDIAKGNMFCKSVFITEQAAEVFQKLRQEQYLLGCTIDTVPSKLAYYLSEINAIHPFREGNGRTQRAFIECLANVAGYHVDFTTISSNEMVEASALAFNCDYSRMTDIFNRITSTISLEEQESFIAKVATPGSVIPVLYHNLIVEETDLQEEENFEMQQN